MYNPWCAFCRACARLLSHLDHRHRIILSPVSSDIHLRDGRRLTRDELLVQLHVISDHDRVERGFYACRRIAVQIPLLWPLLPFLYFPGAGLIGRPAYRWAARNRSMLSQLMHLT